MFDLINEEGLAAHSKFPEGTVFANSWGGATDRPVNEEALAKGRERNKRRRARIAEAALRLGISHREVKEKRIPI